MKKSMKNWCHWLMLACVCMILMAAVPAQAKTLRYGDKAQAQGEGAPMILPENLCKYEPSEASSEDTLDASTATMSDSKLLVEICKRIRSALLKGQSNVDVTDLNIPSTEKYSELMSYLYYYCPYFDNYGISMDWASGDGSKINYVLFTNHYSASDTKLFISDVDNGINKVLAEVKSTDSTLTKLLVVHDYMASHYEYDTNFNCYNASDHLIYGRGVCQAYAYLYKYFMDVLGVTCYTSVSSNHMWNVVSISGKKYIVDVTWDDPISDVFGRAEHDWFLISDAQMMAKDTIDHVKDPKHPCTSTTYTNSYFRNVESPIMVDGNYRYYTNQYSVVRYNVSTKAKKTLTSCNWSSGLFLYDGRLYYNLDNKVKTYKLSSGSIGTFYTSNMDSSMIRKEGDKIGILDVNYSIYGGSVAEADYKELSLTTVDKPSIKSATNSSTGIKLSWNKSADVTGYYIYRKTSSTDYTKIATVKAGTTTYTDAAVKDKNGIGYTYKVVAYRGHLTSKYSSKYIYRLKSSPISSLTNSAAGAFTVKWTSNTKSAGYEIEYSTSSTGSNPKKVTVTGGERTSRKVSSLTKGKTYYVRVRNFKEVSGKTYYSGWSSRKSVKIAS